MEKVILEHGWDGEWFLRAYDDFGAKIGSKECEEGKIFIESNGFCVLAGIGLEDGKAARLWRYAASGHQARHRRAAAGLLPLLPQPGRDLLVSAGIQGERGHLLPRQSLGDDRRNAAGPRRPGHDYYSRINPSAREEISDLHRCEPYVYAQMIAGKDAPTFGEAKNSWLTGTAAWNYYAIVQWILGIRTDAGRPGDCPGDSEELAGIHRDTHSSAEWPTRLPSNARVKAIASLSSWTARQSRGTSCLLQRTDGRKFRSRAFSASSLTA
jgi:cellobiose phosphorylase